MPLPWFKRQGEEIPKELEGLEANDLVSAVQKSKEVDALKQELEETKTKLSEVDSIKMKLAQLEGNRQPAPQPPPNQPTSFLDDENQAFNERLQPFAELTLSNQAKTARFIARQSLKGVDAACWDKWSGEIDQVMQNVHLSFQAVPDTWINALTTVKGRHMNELLKMQQDGSDFFAEAEPSTGGGFRQQSVPDKLSAEEEKLALRLGLKPEDYLKNKKEMVIRAEH